MAPPVKATRGSLVLETTPKSVLLKATPSLRASLAPPGTLTPPATLVSVDRKEVQFNTLSKAIAQALHYGNEVCFRASYLASSLGIEVDEICHFTSKNREKRSRTEVWFTAGLTMVSSFVADALKPTGNGPPSQPQMDDSEETWDQQTPSTRQQEWLSSSP